MSSLLNELRDIGAIKFGHFVLSSGLHSDAYMQCARLGEYPEKVHDFCVKLACLFDSGIRERVTCIVSPALGGVVFGYEFARIVGARFIFCERVERKMCLRRNFEIYDSDNVIIMEDVVTTGKTSEEVFDCIEAICPSSVLGFASIVNRGEFDSIRGMKLTSLVKFSANVYPADEVPEELSKIPISTPGSRYYNK